jgi:hypothetical protein
MTPTWYCPTCDMFSDELMCWFCLNPCIPYGDPRDLGDPDPDPEPEEAKR